MSYQIDWNVSIDCVSKESLLKKLDGDARFILVDTIGTFDGNRYRIRGATTIPYPDVADRRRELLDYDEIIIYCASKRCKASKKAATALKMLNVPNVKIYEGGLEEWKANNLPLEEY